MFCENVMRLDPVPTPLKSATSISSPEKLPVLLPNTLMFVASVKLALVVTVILPRVVAVANSI